MARYLITNRLDQILMYMIKNSIKQQVKALLKQYSWKLTSEEIFITHCYFGFCDHTIMTAEVTPILFYLAHRLSKQKTQQTLL